MSAKKDMKRIDLAVPYQAPPAAKAEATDISSTLSSTLPMAAMYTRNRYIGWGSVVFAVQSWLGESEETARNATTPGYFTMGMSIMALAMTYMPLFMPQVPKAASGTSAPAPVPA